MAVEEVEEEVEEVEVEEVEETGRTCGATRKVKPCTIGVKTKCKKHLSVKRLSARSRTSTT